MISEKTIQKQPDHYCIKRVRSPAAHSTFPGTAFRKQYLVRGPEVETEMRILMMIKKLQWQGLQTTQYLHHIISDGVLYLFFDAFDCVLSTRIDHWNEVLSEKEIWHHMYTLSRTLSVLHEANLYHRNLTPDSIYMRGDEVFIGNYDDGIELPNGVSVLQATIRGSVDFLSPQTALVREHPETYTYGWMKKEDAWGLGLILLGMATFRKNKELQKLFPSPNRTFEQSQVEISRYVRSRLQGRYSHYLADAILALLQVDHDQRPSPQEFFHRVLPNFYHEANCLGCHVSLRMVWTCPHILCDNCHFEYLHKHQQTYKLKHCSCSGDVDQDLMLLMPNRSRLMTCGIKQITQPCKNMMCQAEHPVLKGRIGSLKPYYIRCSCGISFCSFCKRDEKHSVLGIAKLCDKFINKSTT
jgi:serine/threonine protein kinase